MRSLRTQTHIYSLDDFSLSSQSDFRGVLLRRDVLWFFATTPAKCVVLETTHARSFMHLLDSGSLNCVQASKRVICIQSRQVDVGLTRVCDGALSCVSSSSFSSVCAGSVRVGEGQRFSKRHAAVCPTVGRGWNASGSIFMGEERVGTRTGLSACLCPTDGRSPPSLC